MLHNKVLILTIYILITFFLKHILYPHFSYYFSFERDIHLSRLFIAIPEQIILYYYEGNLSLVDRFLILLSTYSFILIWNGSLKAPKNINNEFVWIILTSLYAYRIMNIELTTALLMVFVNLILTLIFRKIEEENI